MSTLDKVQEIRKSLGLDKIEERLDAKEKAEKAESAKLAEQKRLDEETARMTQLVKEATGEHGKALEGALELITTLDSAMKESKEDFAKSVQEMQEQIKSQSAEITELLAARNSKVPGAVAADDSLVKAFGRDAGRAPEDFAKSAEDAVLLASVLGVKALDTKLGANLHEKVNSSSSIEVSSDDYETIFSTRIMRDIQEQLIVGNLFQELPMTAASFTFPIEPSAGMATWVAASTYGTDATTGNELAVALTERTFSTHKLAARVFITDETSEDAIIPLLPILRRHLVEAHARAIEMAFMRGTGTGQPSGLLTLANTDSHRVTSTATADGTTKVSALMLHMLRRQLGTKGLRMNDLVLIVSEDAYYDLLEDPAFQDVDQVGAAAVKLQGQLGRIYGMPVVISEWFPAKAASAEFATLVYTPDFVVPRIRSFTVERDRLAAQQRDAYYGTQRVTLERYFTGDNVASIRYAA